MCGDQGARCNVRQQPLLCSSLRSRDPTHWELEPIDAESPFVDHVE